MLRKVARDRQEPTKGWYQGIDGPVCSARSRVSNTSKPTVRSASAAVRWHIARLQGGRQVKIRASELPIDQLSANDLFHNFVNNTQQFLALPMKAIFDPASPKSVSFLALSTLAICALAVISLYACASDVEDSAKDRMIREMEVSLEALRAENAELKSEIAVLHEVQEDLNAQIRDLEDIDSKADWNLGDKDQQVESKDEQSTIQVDSAVEATARMAEEAGGQVHYIEHAGRGDRTVLVTPREIVDGETPLIVSLHGFGGNSFYQSSYVPLHERVNTDGFALLLPNGVRDAAGNRFWNPTDHCCEGGKSGEDDIAYLTELVAEARKFGDFGHIYFFGYSNGGFMSHHIACKGLSGLRAIVSLAGTSYVEDSTCEGAPPVSVLHIHGTEDSVIPYEGAEIGPNSDGERAILASAQDMVTRWSRIAGCDWPEDPTPYAMLDLDQWVPGSETQAFRVAPACADGISIEFWKGVGSEHSPAIGETFVDALLTWLFAQD